MLIRIKRKAHGSMENVKAFLYISYFFYWVSSILVVGVALHVYHDRTVTISKYIKFGVDPSFLLVTLGCFLFLSTTLGCIGSQRENIFVLKIYLYLAVLLILMCIIIGVLSLSGILYGRTNSNIAEYEMKFKKAMQGYQYENSMNEFVDEIQENLQCCGIKELGYRDWNINPYFNCTWFNPNPRKCSVPKSCCKPEWLHTRLGLCNHNTLRKPMHDVQEVVNTEGCIHILKSRLDKSSIIIGLLSLANVIPLFTCICLVVFLSANIENDRLIFLKTLPTDE